MIYVIAIVALIAIALLYQLGAARKAKRERQKSLNSPMPTPHWQRSNERGWDSSYEN